MRNLKLMLALLAATFSLQTTAQTILTESFDNTTFPPAGWASVSTSYTGGSGQQAWYRVTSGSSPTCSPHSGAGMASFNIYSIFSGSTTELRTPALNFATYPGGMRMVSFWMYRDNGYLGYNEGVNVYVNTTATSSGGTLLGTVHRATDMAPIVSATGWYEYSFLVPGTFSGTTNYVIFEGFSAYGNNEFIDDISIINFIPCTAPSGLAVSGITSTTANLSWTPIQGTAGYEYVINQTAGAPATPGTPTMTAGVNATGLTPATNYFLHVRNKCNTTGTGPGDISLWVDLPFTTYPPCTAPVGFGTVNLTSTATTIKWRKLISASSYDYVVDQTKADPISSTGLSTVTDTFDHLTGLTEDTKYYVHIRANCAGNEQSGWSLDSFTTPLVCRSPQVNVTYLSADNAVAYWEPVPSATHYDIAINKTGVAPAVGTKITGTYQNMSALQPGTTYYVFVKSHCSSVGIVDESDWDVESFSTYALGVDEVNKTDVVLSAYPNPAKDVLNISVSGSMAKGGQIQITDVAGRVIYETTKIESATKVDIHHLTNGIYFVKYKDSSQQRTIKIVKQ